MHHNGIRNIYNLTAYVAPTWPVSIRDKPLEEPYDRYSPLTARINMGVFVKRSDHGSRPHNPPEDPCLGRILAASADKVLLVCDDFKNDTVHRIELDRATFEKEWIGD